LEKLAVLFFFLAQNFFNEHCLVLEQKSRNYTSYTLCDSACKCMAISDSMPELYRLKPITIT